MTKKIERGATEFESKVQSPKSKVLSSKFKYQSSKFKVGKVFSRYLNLSEIACVSLILLSLLNFACVNQSLKANKNTAANVPENNVSEYEKDLRTMETANFDYVFVFRRKDGNIFDGEDKKYVKANSPGGTNRFILTDNDKAVIAGSRYVFSPENLEALQNRFLIEDFSRVKGQEAEKNTNANK